MRTCERLERYGCAPRWETTTLLEVSLVDLLGRWPGSSRKIGTAVEVNGDVRIGDRSGPRRTLRISTYRTNARDAAIAGHT
jgi:hypothetical protein